MYPLTEEVPKTLLKVKGQPILRYLVKKLTDATFQVEELILVSNHRFAQAFQQWFSSSNLKVAWSVLDDGSTSEESRLGSMGDLAFAIRSHGLQEDLLVLGSDNLFQDDLTGFVAFAKEKAPRATLGSYELPDRTGASRYGVLTVDGEGRILSLEEKPPHPSSGLVSTAVYFFPRTTVPLVLEYVGSSKSTDTLGSYIHWLIARVPVFTYRFRGPWFDIGDTQSYTHAQESFIP